MLKDNNLGLASLITQLVIVIIIIATNNIITKYSYNKISSTNKAYRVLTPLEVIEISMKVFRIIAFITAVILLKVELKKLIK